MKKWYKVTALAEWLVEAVDEDDAEQIACDTEPDTLNIKEVEVYNNGQ